uniref:Uncharacterized protein n=1 Tax=Eutreptiella gymnastica TaxID=73025 RepID=A0A7S4G510_9EUGL
MHSPTLWQAGYRVSQHCRRACTGQRAPRPHRVHVSHGQGCTSGDAAGFKSGCQGGYWWLEKRLGGKVWRLHNGWRAVGSGRNCRSNELATPKSRTTPAPAPSLEARACHEVTARP